MTKLNLDDLPPKLRKQVIAQMAAEDQARLGRRSRGGDPKERRPKPELERRSRWVCRACRYRPTSEADIERHADEHQHHRIEWVIPYVG